MMRVVYYENTDEASTPVAIGIGIFGSAAAVAGEVVVAVPAKAGPVAGMTENSDAFIWRLLTQFAAPLTRSRLTPVIFETGTSDEGHLLEDSALAQRERSEEATRQRARTDDNAASRGVPRKGPLAGSLQFDFMWGVLLAP